jgi:hypothetical protein
MTLLDLLLGVLLVVSTIIAMAVLWTGPPRSRHRR